TRCTLSGEATVDLTFPWSLEAIEEEIVENEELAVMAEFFNMTVEELKAAIDNQEIAFSLESGETVTIAAPYVDVTVAANTPPAEEAYTASATYTYTPADYPDSPWVFTVNVNVTIETPEDGCLLKAEAWWVNDLEDLRIGQYEVDEEDGIRYVATLNNAFKLDFLNENCAFFAQLSADSRAIPGVRIEQEGDLEGEGEILYKIIFTSEYSLANKVHVDFKSISKDLEADLAAWTEENPEPAIPTDEEVSVLAFADDPASEGFIHYGQTGTRLDGAWAFIPGQGRVWVVNEDAQEAYDAWVEEQFAPHTQWMEDREQFIEDYYSEGGYAVVCELDNVWVVFPIPIGKLEAGNETLTWSDSPVTLGTSVNLYSSEASGEELLWNGVEGSTEANVYGDPTVTYIFTIPANIYPNLTFGESSEIEIPDSPDGDYVVTCTEIGMASPWENPEELVLKGQVVMEHNWMENGGATVDYTVTIPANSANASAPAAGE
ncbi:MAG: hypothetical protein IJL64_00915, partial [Bacteroidales bacterium]|nr:hypothetical protein [Bacteroidales bacterium]